jgi:hypothetical protein
MTNDLEYNFFKEKCLSAAHWRPRQGLLTFGQQFLTVETGFYGSS